MADFNKKWHDLQKTKRYTDVISENHEIKILTDINNQYVYHRHHNGTETLPFVWTVTKNGILQESSPGVPSLINIDTIDTVIRDFYAKRIERPIEVKIH